MMFGLEVFSLNMSEVNKLEVFQRSILRRFQSFPPNTALTAVYGLLGVRPIEQELDLRRLTLLGSIFFYKNSLEFEIAQRQIAVKDLDSDSWFSACNRLLRKYHLPSIYTLMDCIKSMDAWKTTLKKSINGYVTSIWQQDVQKGSLKFLNTGSLSIGKVHHCWSTVPHTVREVKRAITKVRLLSGTYILQTNRAKFNQYEVTDTCMLCGDGAEDRVHFLAVCSKLSLTRKGYTDTLTSILCKTNTISDITQRVGDPDFLSHIIMDCTHCEVQNHISIDKTMIPEIEQLSRNMCYALHLERCQMLSLQLK